MTVETEFLSLEDVLQIAEAVVGKVHIRDIGLLESAVHRPQATVFGEPAYPTINLQAAAIMHSLARNHTLVDGNKRLAWATLRVFLALNHVELSYTVDDAEQFVIAVTVGDLDVSGIALWIQHHILKPR